MQCVTTEHIDYRAIGKRIRVGRVRAELTQEKLAELVDLAPSYMSNIENGKTKLGLPTIVAIANALHMTVDELLCDSVVYSKPVFRKNIARLLEDCSEREIRILAQILEASKAALRRDAAFYCSLGSFGRRG